MSFARKAPPRRDRSDEFASFELPRPSSRMVTVADLTMPTPPSPHVPVSVRFQKVEHRKQQAIRDSARGEDCTVRIEGCPCDPAMTIWSHAPLGDAGKGMGLKSLDLCGAYCCTYCDAVVDGQRPAPPGWTREQVLLAWCTGHLRSLVKVRQKGLV